IACGLEIARQDFVARDVAHQGFQGAGAGEALCGCRHVRGVLYRKEAPVGRKGCSRCAPGGWPVALISAWVLRGPYNSTMISRFFFPERLPAGGEVVLPEALAHHAARVLRLQDGDAVILFDGSGGEVPARLAVSGRRW